MGPNGAGKTTFLRLMHGLERLSGGSATWRAPTVEARHQQAYVFQTPVMMRRSVRDNLAFPLRLSGTGRAAARARAADWLARIGLSETAHRPAAMLSVGRTPETGARPRLIRAPQVLFLDEPCANLDGRATRAIEGLLGEARAAGVRIVMATHDLGQARRLASEVLFIYRGGLHEAAPATAFFEAPQTAEARAFLNGDIVE